MAFLDKQRIRGYGRYFLMRAGGFDINQWSKGRRLTWN